MHCPYCGKPVDDGIPYCPWCGGGLREDTSSPIPSAVFDDEPVTPSNDIPQEQTIARPASVRSQRASSPQPVPTRTRRSTPRYTDDPDNNGGGRLLMGLVVAAAAIGLAFLVWTKGCSRLTPAPVEPVVPDEQQEQPVEPPQEEPQAEPEQQEEEEAPQTEILPRTSLAEYSWEELAAISAELEAAANRDEALALARSYNLVDDHGIPTGSTKPVTLSDGSTLEVFVADVFHDDLTTGGKAGLTFLSWNLPLSHRMNAEDVNAGGWRDSEMRQWLSTSGLSLLPEDLRAVIVPVAKRTNNTGNSHDAASVSATEDSLWIPSVTEVAGSINWTWSSDADNSGGYNSVLNAEGSQYAIFRAANVETDGSNAALSLRGDLHSDWWLRSPSASVTSNFRYVTEEGNPCGFGGASNERGICVGFCL